MISIYCSEKLDGVAAAAIVMRHAVLSKLDVHFGGFLHPASLEAELKDIAQEQQKLIFVLDISISPDHISLIEKINVRNKLVYWNTHDPSSVVPPAKFSHCKTGLATPFTVPIFQVSSKFQPTNFD